MIEFLSSYKVGQYLYPEVIKRNTGYGMDNVIAFLDKLAEKKVLKCLQYIRCPNCNYQTNFYEERVEEEYCDECDIEIKGLNRYYVYRVEKNIGVSFN